MNLPAGARRYAVVVALFVLSMITYIDRVCISTAKEPIAAAMALSDSAMGLVFSAFALGYALAQIPSGWFADRAGPRVALACVVGAWSALTALTGAAWSLASLVAIRFLFGVSEAGAFPGSARAIVNWLPPGERGRANGVLFSGSRLGAALAFPLLAWMLARWSWRPSFLILGAWAWSGRCSGCCGSAITRPGREAGDRAGRRLDGPARAASFAPAVWLWRWRSTSPATSRSFSACPGCCLI